MGREWYWGTGGKSTKRGGGGATSHGGEKDASSSGCMNAVFQFFDFHHFQFPLHHQQPSFDSSILHEEHTIPKGAEAPRNSLQSEELLLHHIPRERVVQEEGNLIHIPMGIQIKTSGRTGSNDSCSEISGSPGTKTPNLVARLMGLDLLPEAQSPSSSSSSARLQPLRRRRQPLQSRPRKSLDKDITGTQSLPETPRISSARRSDVEHRLSLQINKENLSAGEDLEFSRFSYLRRKDQLCVEDDNNRSTSPSLYARQIVKQMKEKVGRKVGLDITNTIANARDQGRSAEQLVTQFKSRKFSKALAGKVNVEESSPGKQHSSTPSCSPRLRFLDPKTKQSTTPPSSTKDRSVSHFSKTSSSCQPSASVLINVQPKPQTLQKQQVTSGQKSVQKSKKIAGERFGQRLKKPPQTSDIIRNKQEEPFVRPTTPPRPRSNIPDKKCKKIPLSNDLLPVKKDPSPPATRIPLKQECDDQKPRYGSQLSSCSSQTYKQEATRLLTARESDNGVSSTGASAAEYQFVANILSRTGIQKDSLVSFSNWFSPSHPLDPSIFQQLLDDDDYYPCATANKRLLLFHLVDELLGDILKPWGSSSTGGGCRTRMQGAQLIQTLCAKIRSFPCADCRVLEDIDGLIEKDLPEVRLQRQSAVAFEEEGEEMVREIEKDIVETLVHETVVEFW